MGLIRGEVVEGGYKPSAIYRILKPKNITGNEINGVGESVLDIRMFLPGEPVNYMAYKR